MHCRSTAGVTILPHCPLQRVALRLLLGSSQAVGWVFALRRCHCFDVH
jgi:hypothetical protein